MRRNYHIKLHSFDYIRAFLNHKWVNFQAENTLYWIKRLDKCYYSSIGEDIETIDDW